MKTEENLAPVHSYNFAGCQHNVYHADNGKGLAKHDHVYAHVTVCHAGKIIIRKEGKEVIFDKTSTPAVLVAGEWHEIQSLEDGTVFENVFAEGMNI